MQISRKQFANKEPEEYFEVVKTLKVPRGGGFGQNLSGSFGIPTPGAATALPSAQGADTGIFSPFATTLREQSNQLTNNISKTCMTVLNHAALINERFPQTF